MLILLAVALNLITSRAHAAGPPVERLRDAYRDQTGNLIVTFARAVADQTSGETLGAMYCDPKNCAELATQYDQRRDGGPFVRFDFAGGGHGDLVVQPRDGIYRLACLNGTGGDLRPASRDDVAKIGEALKTGKIGFTPAPDAYAAVFVGKSATTGRYVYLDANPDRRERLFLGTPGAMSEKTFRQTQAKCDFAGCARTLETGGVMGVLGGVGGWGATRVRIERFAGAIDQDPVTKFNPDRGELTRLRIPGVPASESVNARNPCVPTGAAASAPGSGAGPRSAPSAR